MDRRASHAFKYASSDDESGWLQIEDADATQLPVEGVGAACVFAITRELTNADLRILLPRMLIDRLALAPDWLRLTQSSAKSSISCAPLVQSDSRRLV